MTIQELRGRIVAILTAYNVKYSQLYVKQTIWFNNGDGEPSFDVCLYDHPKKGDNMGFNSLTIEGLLGQIEGKFNGKPKEEITI